MSLSQGSFVAVAIPVVAIFFNYLWIKRKRVGSKSDPGDTSQTSSTVSTSSSPTAIAGTSSNSSPSEYRQLFSRSLSGVESAPIDIIIPPKLRASKSNPVVISDEDLDLEIEKANSMRYGTSFDATNKSNKSSSEVLVYKKKMSETVEAPPVVEPPVVEEIVQNDEENVTEAKEIVNDNNEVQNQNNERDSANHSPADVMLISSSVCSEHSVGSNDSGKGYSNDTTSPTPKDLAVESTPSIVMYEFLIPQTLVGKLIGKNGSSVKSLKTRSGAHVIIRKHPDTNSKLKVCTMEGTQEEINLALKIVREKFPIKRFPEVTLERVTFALEAAPIVIPETLKLVAGINNDTKLCCISSPNNLFLQSYTHPTFPNLEVLTVTINAHYDSEEAPFLPSPVVVGTICVAFNDMWHRASVEAVDNETGIYKVKLLDYGGFATVEYEQLRQIRRQFLLLPFQAIECVLANIETTEENGLWQAEAYTALSELMREQDFVLTQVIAYNGNTTFVNCYIVLQGIVVFLNDELVKLGFARWTNDEAREAGAVRELSELSFD